MSGRVAAALAITLLFGRGAFAEVLPAFPMPADRTVQITFEILPAEPSRPLPPALSTLEGGRLILERTESQGRTYRRLRVIFPLPDGDTLERVIYFQESAARVPMIGFHRFRRHLESPAGETIVFNAGPENPLTGRSVAVPGDTYVPLALLTALAAVEKPMAFHLWGDEDGVESVEAAPAGIERLSILGTEVPSRRIRLSSARGESLYWFGEQPVGGFLQYRGPGDFLIQDGDAPDVVLRATSSSEQVHRLFSDP